MNETEILKRTQKIELEILLKVQELLLKHGITPLLTAGTCLGAVRHKGFIPWDDDVDIMLMRNDYERAKQILQNELPEEYIYCDYKTEKDYPYDFAKVRKRGTAFVHAGDAHLNIHHGIYIDIFPLDYVDGNHEAFQKEYRKALTLRKKIDLSYMSIRKYGKLRPIYQILLILLGRMFLSSQKEHLKLEKLICSYQKKHMKSGYIGCYVGSPLQYPERIISEAIPVEFEGESFYIPKDYDQFLNNLYGDYMELPPEEKRVSHHDVILINFTSEYHPK